MHQYLLFSGVLFCSCFGGLVCSLSAMSKYNDFKLSGNRAIGGEGDKMGSNDLYSIRNYLKLLCSKQSQKRQEIPLKTNVILAPLRTTPTMLTIHPLNPEETPTSKVYLLRNISILASTRVKTCTIKARE